MSILYIDLDGTLIDIQRRHYAAYLVTARELGVAQLSEGEYWERRRAGADHADLIYRTGPATGEPFLSCHDRLEPPSYVRLDTLIPGARAALASLRASYEFVLAVLRHDREALTDQLDDLSLRKLLSAISCVGGRDEALRLRARDRPATDSTDEGIS